jgi:hypothetical protein
VWSPLLPPLWQVHPPPRSSPSISCRVHKLVVNPVRLPHLMYYSGRINTYKLDRTTVTVGAPRILEMSTSPASAGASSCASVAAASSVAAGAGSVLPSAAGASASSAPRAPPRWGLGYDYPHLAPSSYPNRLRHPAQRGRKAASPASKGILSSTHNIETQALDYPIQDGLPPGMWSP